MKRVQFTVTTVFYPSAAAAAKKDGCLNENVLLLKPSVHY